MLPGHAEMRSGHAEMQSGHAEMQCRLQEMRGNVISWVYSINCVRQGKIIYIYPIKASLHEQDRRI